MEKKFLTFGVVLLLITGVFLVNGCGSSTQEYQEPKKGNKTTTTENKTETQKKFSVGERAVTEGAAVTVNWVKWVKHVESDNEYVIEPNVAEGKKYIIVDLTVENLLENKSISLGTFLSMELQDDEGYTYGSDYLTYSAIEKAFTSGEIPPGGKRRGRVLFKISRDTKDLNFNFNYEWTDVSSISTFDLPNKNLRYSLNYKEKPETKAEIEIVNVESEWTEYESEYMEDSGEINTIEFNLENTGKISFTPKIGLNITHDSTEVYSTQDAAVFYGEIESGEMKTGEASPYISISETGDYNIQVSIRKEGATKVLATDTFTKTVG